MNILVITYFLNGFLMIAMPIGLAIYLTRRFRLGWRLFWIGMATFILSQVGHIPFNLFASQVLNRTALVDWPQSAQTLFNAIFLGLSAGAFEEVARYLVLRFWAKDARSWRSGILFGVGHGGVEAIILGALVLISYVSMLVVRGMDLTQLVPAEQMDLARQQVEAYWSAPWYFTLFGALERLLTIPCHIAMAVMVMQAFTRRNITWLFAAIGYHALLDFSAVLGIQYLGPYWTEAMIAGFALISVILIIVLRQPEVDIQAGPSQAGAAAGEITPVEETPDNLENTRYS